MKKDNYFFVVNVILLIIVLIGFSPTFYLRPLSSQEPLPFYLIIHGISCTAWFIVIVIQSYLVRKGRIVQHKVYGKYFGLIAPILVLLGYAVLVYSIGNYHMQFPPITSGVEIGGERQFTALIIVGDAIQLIVYLIFVYLGYRYRSNGNFHKRAMLIASILICQQALVRLGKFEHIMIGENPGASGGIYAMIVPLIILLSLLVYDTIKFEKPKRISVIGLVSYIAFVATSITLNISGMAVGLLESLR